MCEQAKNASPDTDRSTTRESGQPPPGKTRLYVGEKEPRNRTRYTRVKPSDAIPPTLCRNDLRVCVDVAHTLHVHHQLAPAGVMPAEMAERLRRHADVIVVICETFVHAEDVRGRIVVLKELADQEGLLQPQAESLEIDP